MATDDPAALPPLTLAEADWQALLAMRAGRATERPAPPDSPYTAIAGSTGTLVVAQLGQSLDGRIATPTGQSHYINGPAALDHLHRLRALADAVIVGRTTVLRDDPALTVRRCAGGNPVRVVLAGSGPLPADRQMFRDGATPVLVLTPQSARLANLPAHVERMAVPAAPDGAMAPAAVLTALAERGFRVILVEGGARTVSAFLAAGRVDRLHVTVAPVIIGSGPAGLQMPAIDRLDRALRPPTRLWRLGDDILFDCAIGG